MTQRGNCSEWVPYKDDHKQMGNKKCHVLLYSKSPEINVIAGTTQPLVKFYLTFIEDWGRQGTG